MSPYACFPGSSVLCSTKLKPTGTEHANLYVEMITRFENLKNYCPVATVYSVNPVLPTGGGGTNNPFYTARPLANTVMNADPIIRIGGMKLDELLTQVTPQMLRTELVNRMKLGSAAVFWTSDGYTNLARLSFRTSKVFQSKTKTKAFRREMRLMFLNMTGTAALFRQPTARNMYNASILPASEPRAM